MLELLRIKNIAIIEFAEVPFKQGLNIISGETGAGKSVVIEAIGLLLGGRARTEWIRAGCDEGVVEGVFNTSQISWLCARLQEFGFPEGKDLILKRTVHRGGKHRISINGELATLHTLQQFCEGLIDLCSQNEHQSLLKPSTQLELVDRFGDLKERAEFQISQWNQVRQLRQEQARLQALQFEQNQRIGFLEFQIEEIIQAKLVVGEDEELTQEKHLQQSAYARAQTTQAIVDLVASEDGAPLELLKAALSKIRSLVQVDPRASSLAEASNVAVAQVEEVILELTRYQSLIAVELDSEKLGQVQDRLSILAELKRKYGGSIHEVLVSLGRFEAELEALQSVDEHLSELSNQLGGLEAELLTQAQALSTDRLVSANKFAKAVTKELKELKMGDAQFSIELSSAKDLSQWSSLGADGVQYVIQTNRGETPRPLGKVASGGELSRIMLSIRRIISDRGGIGVYLFDEIDSGMGGQTAFQVGKKLRSVSDHNQVICITHLPQVASFACHHLAVRKFSEGARTLTSITALSKSEQKKEVARMLGGPSLTRKTLGSAAELLELAQGC